MWRDANLERAGLSYRRWAQKNKPRINALIAKRRAVRLRATPKWANHEAICEIYKRAAELTKVTGVLYEVDHIYPLQGKLVCGLHCEANLQVLTKVENIRKHNRMPEIQE